MEGNGLTRCLVCGQHVCLCDALMEGSEVAKAATIAEATGRLLTDMAQWFQRSTADMARMAERAEALLAELWDSR